MASDLKIEIFAYYCFSDSWLELGVKKTWNEKIIPKIYGDECIKDNSYTEACDKMFINAICCRFYFFSSQYGEEMNASNAEKCESLSDLNVYVTRLLDREDLFGDLNVFEKMLATCAFAQYLFFSIYKKSLIDVINNSHIIWAMYFDKFAEQFYKEGGWNELKRVAKTYDLLYKCLYLLSEKKVIIRAYKEASINYRRFKNIVTHGKHNKISKISNSMQWVRFQTENFNKYVTVSSNYEAFIDITDIEELLQDLKSIFNFSSKCDFDDAKTLADKLQESSCFARMPYFKTFDNRKEIKTEVYSRIQNFSISETLNNETPNNKSNCETQHNSGILASSKEVVGDEKMQKTENFKTVENSSSVMGEQEKKSDVPHNGYNKLHGRIKSLQFKTDVGNSTEIADLHLNYYCTNISFDDEGEKNLDHNSSPRSVERLDEAINVKDILSSNQKEESKWPKHIQKNLPNRRDFCSKNETVVIKDEREHSNNLMESNIYSKYEEASKEIPELSYAATADDMTATQGEKNEVPTNPSSKHFVTEYEITNSDGMINPNEELDKLQEERQDPDIRSFLRMILMLGDRERTQRTSLNNEQQINVSKKSNKKE